MTTFLEFGLRPELQQAIDKLGYTEPTEIQTEVWNAATGGANIIAQSQTGTGKTTAFLLPILQAINNRDRFPQVLIVAPTRELVQQIREDIVTLTTFLPMRSLCLIGGRKLMFQKEDLKYGPQFLVATPGRLIEFIEKRLFDTSKITHFVLDEVDRMLDMGFIEDVDRIWSQLLNIKQTMTFSATINNEIKDIINKHCETFTHIRVGQQITVDKIDHTFIDIAHEHKFATLVDVLKKHNGQKTIVFTQTKRNTEVLTRSLQKEGFTCAYLNGDLDQRERNRALRAFKEGACKILLTTDVAARGLNMDNVELVVNFDVPREPESYIHRIGRTGRAGASGKALMFVDRDEKHLLMDIEKTQKITVKKSPDFVGIEDKKMDYIDVNLDRPLPPSEKKRRMVARSIARERGERFGNTRGYEGGRGYGSSRPASRSSSSASGTSRGYASDRPASRSSSSASGTSRSYASDRPASRSSSGTFGQTSYRQARETTERENTYNSGSRGISRTDSRSRYATRTPRSIGGYDPVEVIQTNINAAKAPRPPRDFSFNESSERKSRTVQRSGDSSAPANRAPARRTSEKRSEGGEKRPFSREKTI